jgi:hypothetical protein
MIRLTVSKHQSWLEVAQIYHWLAVRAGATLSNRWERGMIAWIANLVLGEIKIYRV